MDQDRNQNRDRLREVHRHEQTETRVNEDFVEWLKTKGPSWLLMILVVLTVYLGMVNWRERQASNRAEAWHELMEAQVARMPSTLEAVAEKYAGVDAVGTVAQLSAAGTLLEAVQLGMPLDAMNDIFELQNADDEDLPSLSEEDREIYLDRADRLYASVLRDDDGTWRKALYAVNALNGRAAVAEARGDIDGAIGYYQQAVQRAEADYPHLAAQAQKRLETLDDATTHVTLLREDQVDLDVEDLAQRLRPLELERELQDMLLRAEDLAPPAPARPRVPDVPAGQPQMLPPEVLEQLPPELLEQLQRGEQQQPPSGLPDSPQ